MAKVLLLLLVLLPALLMLLLALLMLLVALLLLLQVLLVLVVSSPQLHRGQTAKRSKAAWQCFEAVEFSPA